MDNRSIEPKLSDGRSLSVEMASDSLIRRKTASEALQHPATLLPGGVCVISVFYSVLLSPMLGAGVGAIALAVVSGATATGSYLYQYHKKYPRVAREMTERFELERIRLEEASLRRFCDGLQAGFLSVASTEGLRTLAELTGAYQQLKPAIDQRRITDPLSVSLVPALAGETYRTGLSVLSNALELMKLVSPDASATPKELGVGDKDRLVKEIGQLERIIKSIKHRPGLGERLNLATEMLASRKERLAMTGKLQLHIDRLLHEAKRCEASLYSTQIELASIRTGGTKTSVDMVIEALQVTIRQAKDVQDEFERLRR